VSLKAFMMKELYSKFCKLYTSGSDNVYLGVKCMLLVYSESLDTKLGA